MRVHPHDSVYSDTIIFRISAFEFEGNSNIPDHSTHTTTGRFILFSSDSACIHPESTYLKFLNVHVLKFLSLPLGNRLSTSVSELPNDSDATARSTSL